MINIDYLSQTRYEEGADGIEVASWWAATILELAYDVREVRRTNPDAYPTVKYDMDPETVARIIVGRILDTGWTPPSPSDLADIRANRRPA